MIGWVRRAAVLLVVGSVVLVAGAFAAEAQEVSGPTLTVDRTTINPGEQVVITLDGWRSRVITLSVCGNQAARGSMDCNMVASEGIGRNRDGSATSRDFTVTAPTLPCPCVLRASSTTNDEVAIAPIELVGHPSGPVVGSPELAPLDVSVEARRAGTGVFGALRSSLGGPTSYDVTVRVHNRTGATLQRVVLAGAARGARGDVEGFDLVGPAVLEAGQTWEHTVRATVPAPTLGSVTWEVTAAGAGPSVTTTSSTRNTPLALYLLLLVLAGDVVAIIARRRASRSATSTVDAQRSQELSDPALDVVADRADGVEVLAGRVL